MPDFLGTSGGPQADALARQLKREVEFGGSLSFAQIAAEAKTAISFWWLDMVFPEEHVAPRCYTWPPGAGG